MVTLCKRTNWSSNWSSELVILIILLKTFFITEIIYVRDQDYNDQTARQILCHKLDVWAYEEEKRIFTMNEQYVKISVHEIITGRGINTRDISLITELIEKINPDIEIIRADDIM